MKQTEMMENRYLSEKGQKLEQFIINMPINTWYTTRNNEEIIDIIKQWIDGDFMWPKFTLEFNYDYSKFRKIELEAKGMKTKK
jgi:hypothetical protein